MKIRTLTESFINQLNDIYEFRTFTQLSYNLFEGAVSEGLELTTFVPQTEQRANQETIRDKLHGYQNKYLIELSFQHSVSIFETWLFDIFRVLLQDPYRLNKQRKIEVSDIIKSKDLEDLNRMIIDSELNDIKYKPPSDWFQYLKKFVNGDIPSSNEIERIIEMKASRDILVHNNGIANQIYLSPRGVFKDPPGLGF